MTTVVPRLYTWTVKDGAGIISEAEGSAQKQPYILHCFWGFQARPVLPRPLYIPMPQFPYLQKRHCAFYFTGLLWVLREKEEERRPSAHWLLVEASNELHFFTPTVSITSASTMMGHWRGYWGHSDGPRRQKNFCPPGASGHSSIPKRVNEASYYYNSTFLLLIAK